MIRLAEYIEARDYFGKDHEKAVKKQNSVAARVRKAIGFSYPKQDINV
jgi:hypothetical protein